MIQIWLLLVDFQDSIYVQGEWVECYSEHYNVFSGRSEKFLKLVTEELRQRKKRHAQNFSITATDIATFIQSAEVEEAVLSQQLTDNQQKYVLQQINNGTISALRENSTHVPLVTNSLNNEQINSTQELATDSDSITPDTYKTFEEVFDV